MTTTRRKVSSLFGSHTGLAGRRRRVVQYFLLFVGVVLAVDALVGDKGLLAMMQAREEYSRLEGSLGELRANNARLREEARRLREDPAAVEDLARGELGMIKPGEKLFIVKELAPWDPPE